MRILLSCTRPHSSNVLLFRSVQTDAVRLSQTRTSQRRTYSGCVAVCQSRRRHNSDYSQPGTSDLSCTNNTSTKQVTDTYAVTKQLKPKSMSWFGRRASSAEPANAAAAQGEPLLLIGFNDSTQKWEVGQDALRALKGISGPLCTISVCGRARQGKSFLLNQMLGKFTGVDKFRGFIVSPTQQSCTRGIWMWSHPVQIPGPDGRKCNTILMDCEGVDAVDQGAQHSAQIFSMAMLLSSIFIYNQVGAIDAIAIERLAMVCELAKRIKDRSTVGDNNGVAAAAGQVDFSPSFIWLLRDFQLRLEANGKPISPSEYLEEALLPIKATGAADIANKNQMRQTIKAVFPYRDVSVMVRPALTEADLQKLDSLPNASLRPEFRKDMDEFMRVVKSKAKPMAVGGTLISGVLMAGLAKAYVQAVNEGAVPQLVTAWQGVSRAECQKAFEQAEKLYNTTFQVAGVTEESVLYDKHQAAAAAAMTYFRTHAMGESELVKEFEERLTKGFEERYAEERRKLAVSGERLATDMLGAEAVKLRGVMTGPGASIEAVESELRRFLDEYDLKVPSGAFKYKKAAEFLMNTIIIGIKNIVKDIVTAKEAAAARATAAETSVTQLKAEVARLKDAEARASSTRTELLTAQQETAHLKGQLESKDRHAAGLENELRTLRQQQSDASTAQAQVQQDLGVARADIARLQGQLGAAGRLQGQLDDLRSQLAQAAQRETTLQQQKAAAEQEARQKGAQLASAQQSVERLQQQVTAGQPELEALRARVEQLDRELQEAKVGQARVSGELEEERKKTTAKMEELAKVSAHNSELSQQVASLNAELVAEHKGRDALKAELAALKANVTSPPAATPAAAAAGGGRAGAAGRATGGRSAKRKRTEAVPEDEEMQDAEPVPEAAPESPAATPATAAAAAGTPKTINKDLNPANMTIAELKSWVTDNSLEDDEFFKMSQASKTKKADWIKYVKQKLQSA